MAGPDGGQWAGYTRSVEERLENIERVLFRLVGALNSEANLRVDYVELIKEANFHEPSKPANTK